jgi:hypothetical protein
VTHDEVFDMTQQLINQRIYERNHPMKTVIIKTEDGRVVAMLVQQPNVQTDKDFDELAMALLLTLLTNTGLNLIKEETK